MKKILILGGGTAGWMAANLFAKMLNRRSYAITLVESPQLGIIGVGEGSTPQLKKFFDILDIPESEWMPACHATYKNGISFVDWTEHTQHNRYFHPFPSPFDRATGSAFLYHSKLRSQGMDVPVCPDDFFLSAKLAQRKLSPKPKPNKPQIPLNYAYHFDSAKLGDFLSIKAKEAGVTHIEDELSSHKSAINYDEFGNICSLSMQSGNKYSADLFIDCTGFSSRLIQQSLKVPFHSFSDMLFNDAAVAIPTKSESTLPSETKAQALSNGWSWHIPLTNRTGNGYVYCSKYISAEEAELELLKSLGYESKVEYESANPNLPAIKHLRMKVGQVTKHWHKNVLALGLSQGFIEPLEATALHLVQETILQFIQLLGEPVDVLSNTVEDEKARELKDKFNDKIRKRFEGVRDYIVAHYKLNTRNDSQYWIDNRNNQQLSPQLEAVLESWYSARDINTVLNNYQMTSYYPAVSWFCLLAGYGAFPEIKTENKLPEHAMRQMQEYILNNTQHFEEHSVALASLSEHKPN
ncbi:tryptophan 7-halogenase [Glaciecola sp. MH2013]|uniref:tryptophan halogenase family protein n=1 Tax=Glaciecola sp. MH2013 TaxID=2785524 RepID=UPI00189FF4FB|nr:tryptophan halogenase family protein [Glaciecola sp. MH2013]MBF7072692.1 tryptophan 7-halogenase [Glaciecola sp. MH2013]